MNKIINGKRYDTDTAKEVGCWENMDDVRNFDYLGETLYRKRTGEFFLHCEGGARTPYASFSGDGWAGFGEVLRPLGYAEACKWAEEHMTGDEYEAVFGEVGEDAGNVPVTLSIPAAAKAELERRASETGRTQSDIVAGLISDSAVEFAPMSDENILHLDEIGNAPRVTEGGECYVVQSVTAHIEGGFARILKVADVAVFATVGEAYDCMGRLMRTQEDDSCSALKHMHAVCARIVR